MDLKNLKNKIKNFGCETVEIDGHNIKKIYESLIDKKQNNKPQKNKPKQISKDDQTSTQINNNTNLSKNVFGRVIVDGVGVIDIKDKTTFELAKSFIAIIEKKVSGIS